MNRNQTKHCICSLIMMLHKALGTQPNMCLLLKPRMHKRYSELSTFFSITWHIVLKNVDLHLVKYEIQHNFRIGSRMYILLKYMNKSNFLL